MRKFLIPIMAVLIIASFSCSRAKYIDPDVVSKVEGTGIESRDVRAVANQMAADLLSSNALASSNGVKTIAVLGVKNRTRFIIDQDIITTLLTDTLINKGAGKVTVLNRDILNVIQRERRMKRAGNFSGEEKDKMSGADFFLEGEIRGLNASQYDNQTDYVVFRFTLTDANTSALVWSKEYQMKKEGKWGVQYQ